MKRSLLLITALFGATTIVTAQITINSTDVVGEGYTVIAAIDSVTPFGTGSAGANQTWDFSALLEHTTSTMTFTNTVGAPGTSAFPTANLLLASDDPEDDSTYIFIQKNTSMLRVVGIVSIQPNGDTTITDFVIDIITFPSTIGTSFTSNTSGVVLFSDTVNFDPDAGGPHPIVDSIKMVRASSLVSEFDAWGTVITPLGSYAVLRQDKNELTTDSVFMKTNGTWKLISPELSVAFGGMDSVNVQTTYSMDWWSDDPAIGFPLVSFEYNNGTSMNDGKIEWLKASPTIGIYESNRESEVVVFPNPNSGRFTVHYSAENSSAKVSVYDNMGRLLIQESIKEQLHLNLDDAAGGIYLIRIEDGTSMLTKKIVVK